MNIENTFLSREVTDPSVFPMATLPTLKPVIEYLS